MATTKNKKSRKHKQPAPTEPDDEPPEQPEHQPAPCADYPQRMKLDVQNGVILIGSDGHYVPDQPIPTGHRAFVKFAKTMQSNIRAIAYNGDAFDFGSVSRFGRRMWDHQHL